MPCDKRDERTAVETGATKTEEKKGSFEERAKLNVDV